MDGPQALLEKEPPVPKAVELRVTLAEDADAAARGTQPLLLRWHAGP